MASAETTEQKQMGQGWKQHIPMFVNLFKVRVASLLLMAATGGAFMAAEGWPGWNAMILLWVTGSLATFGSSAWNEYLERDRDVQMKRTRGKRPLVNGTISDPRWVPVVATLLIFVPAFAVFPSNPELTFFLLLGAFIYVVLYTILLKPRTLLNIVIGGAAGSAAVLSGSAAVGQWDHTGALLLALLLFLWTPFHFWSLALLYREDYAKVDVPMLPARTTPYRAAWWVMLHTVPTAFTGLALVVMPNLGWVYFVPTAVITVYLVIKNINLIRDPSAPQAKAMFMASNYYLTVLLLMIYIDSLQPYLK